MCYLVTKWHLAASMQGTGVSHTPSDPSHNTVFDYINMDMNILGICRTYIMYVYNIPITKLAKT